MKRSSQVFTARLAGVGLMTAALVSLVGVGAGTAHAAPEAAANAAAPYAQQVAVGTAVKIGNPAFAAPTATDEPVDVSTVTATPTDAVVIATESHQAEVDEGTTVETSEPADTSVAVLGTKIGVDTDGDTLAQTGPGSITPQLLVALALIGLGAVVRFAPSLVPARRRH